jgi:AcrR family transcriptional regulator
MTASTTRRPRRDAARNYQLVVDAARELLEESGVEASMEQIAARAGVGVGTVYRRFSCKESLVEELVKMVSDELSAAADQLLDHDEGTGLEEFLRILGRSFTKHHRWTSLLMPGRPTSEPGKSTIQGQLAQLFQNAHRAGTVGPQVELGDVMALIWGLRAVAEATGSIAPDAWTRYLDIHLRALRSSAQLSDTPATSAEQLRQLSEA